MLKPSDKEKEYHSRKTMLNANLVNSPQRGNKKNTEKTNAKLNTVNSLNNISILENKFNFSVTPAGSNFE